MSAAVGVEGGAGVVLGLADVGAGVRADARGTGVEGPGRVVGVRVGLVGRAGDTEGLGAVERAEGLGFGGRTGAGVDAGRFRGVCTAEPSVVGARVTGSRAGGAEPGAGLSPGAAASVGGISPG
ncbi:hypothetical protein ABZ759_19500, partial [Streptomyces sp. NPDC047860]